jgi:hypothetical protein
MLMLIIGDTASITDINSFKTTYAGSVKSLSQNNYSVINKEMLILNPGNIKGKYLRKMSRDDASEWDWRIQREKYLFTLSRLEGDQG